MPHPEGHPSPSNLHPATEVRLRGLFAGSLGRPAETELTETLTPAVFVVDVNDPEVCREE